MMEQATIRPINAPVHEMLTPEEESLVALASHIITQKTIEQLSYEQSHQVPEVQQ